MGLNSPADLVLNLKRMEVNLPDNQEAQFKEQVRVGMDQIARGEFIEEEEMDDRVERMLPP